jgi:hypothetical protein
MIRTLNNIVKVVTFLVSFKSSSIIGVDLLVNRGVVTGKGKETSVIN